MFTPSPLAILHDSCPFRARPNSQKFAAVSRDFPTKPPPARVQFAVANCSRYNKTMNTPDNTSFELAPRAANGQLLPGSRLNSNGRPVGSYSGFRRIAQIIVNIALEPENMRAIQTAMQEEMRKNPARYARKYILPLTPYKDRRALLDKIRQMEKAAAEKPAAPFSNESITQ